MGGFYDSIIATQLPPDAYRSAAAGSTEAAAFAQAIAGPEILKVTLVIPIMLIVAFGGLFLYMRGRKKPQLQTV